MLKAMLDFDTCAVLCCVDHYGGITDTWPGGPIYCTEVTARLVHLLTGIPQQLLRPVPLDVPTTIAGDSSPSWFLPVAV